MHKANPHYRVRNPGFDKIQDPFPKQTVFSKVVRSYGPKSMVQLLVELGADVNERDCFNGMNGATTLMYMARLGNFEAAIANATCRGTCALSFHAF